ncbi:reverse transcriptase domain-containing protein [Tanacetum coccineum]|uniref:Reverse transcriptase domain-containing protein n=1 Tax=Tanacetum coccineum TaxID=301880 RepID=A0ABQ4ZSE8_9ASTR
MELSESLDIKNSSEGSRGWRSRDTRLRGHDEVYSPPDHLKDKSSLDASTKLTRAKPNKHSGDADLLKDKSGSELPLEFHRSWCVEGHLGDEGLSFRGTKLNSIFITIENEGLQAFMDRFKSKSSHIKGVPPVLHISAFMHGHGHLELAKKLNDKIPKTVDKMFKRVRAFIRGEVVTGLAEMLKKQIEEDVALGKLAHLVKDIRRNNQRSGNQGRNGVKIINMIREGGNHKRPFEEGRSSLTYELTFSAIHRNQLTDEPIILEGIIEGNQVRRILVDGGSSSDIMYKHCFKDLNVNIRSRLKRCRALMVGFSGETYHPLGVIDLRVTMGRTRRSKTVLIEFAIIKCCSPYNIIIGRIKMRSLEATARKGARFMEGGPVSLEKTWDRDDTEEVFTISYERPDQ